ncbi:MAG: cache domain-containing protein, partial [Alphaproteobacteria bacterium]
MTLGARIAVTLVALIALVAIALGGVAYGPLSNSIYTERLASMRSSARLVARDLAGTVQSAAADVRLIAGAPGVRDMIEARWAGDVASEAEARVRLQSLLLSMMEARPEYVQARLIGADPEGREIVRVDRPEAGAPTRILARSELQPKARRDYYQATMARPAGALFVSSIDLNREYGDVTTPHKPVARVAMPVFLPSGAPFGMVVVNIDMRPAFARARQAVDDSTEVRIADGLGRYLAHPDPARAFGFEFGDTGRIVDEFPDLTLADGGFSLGGRPLQGDAVAVRSEDRSGQSVVLAAASEGIGDGQKILLLLSSEPVDLIAAGMTALGRYAIAGTAASLAAIG